ncbi:hypothetical protein PF005_g19073 [Phytophthora fragariae]|uniref:WW domain-containing protein n=1 Tax=Phytophthora fragariae TaxID=53985 RepID=A0A6A3J5N9_9STRA|nr:hypothetical protein PF003_g32210 [Phytophthora fragariae]KAE8938993.1 hypothetical protein PF009_g11161 [Phytophthora fragariae]KAE8990559.1 hypothetical protein PF011_g18311 [Phytophthora fragariae]KAE9123967.1 hypothetical protein PF010_g6188 [Phytophthora fragariae]KAE9147190.1 hypothetical protein PF006_g8114 [Phytophthora fragariae]
MRTELDASAARIKKKKRSSERSKRHDRPLEDGGGEGGEWKQFTSPDGHPYYYNAVTKESRWEPPTEEQPKHLRPKGSSKQMDMEQETPLNEAPAENKTKKEKKKRPESRRSVTEEAPAVRTSKNAMFQKLQASLEGRLNGAMMGRPPPRLDIRQVEAERQQEEKKTPSLEEQYEAETAGMSAAERLRFLRKKRQENMMARRESVAGDDFMAEVANNMKKKGKSKEEKDSGEKVTSWKEQEKVEEERKRQQMQEEMEAKEKEEERKEREEQEARERELRREQERAEQVALEERREQERRQRQEEEDRRRLEKEKKRKKRKEKKNSAELEERGSERDAAAAREKDGTEPNAQGFDGVGAQDEEVSDASSPERVRHRSRSRSRGSKRGSTVRSLQYESAKAAASSKDDHSPVEDGHSALSAEVASDPVLFEKQRVREERRARKLREKELMASKRTESATSESQRRKSVSSAGDITEDSSTRTTSSAEAEEEARAIEKQLRRERRRVAKLEAALAAQGLDDDHGNVQHERSQAEHTEQHATSSNASTPGSAHAGNYPMNGQNPPLSGGMYAPYPYMMMPPPPPYGYYYPYMQPPPMMPAPMYPPGMVGVPPGYQLVPPTPPPSSDGMATPSAMVPYSAESTLESAYGMPFGSMYGQQSAPELSRCDCCQGIGVGLVEKNGVCGHCNRLRLAFIVDSAQMRQRCSVCGGWGFQLLQANGMCEHCTRLTAQKSTGKLISEARRRSSVATPLAARASLPPKRNSMPKNNTLDDVDWDKSSSDDSDWDD